MVLYGASPFSAMSVFFSPRSDEDIHTIVPSTLHDDDKEVAAQKKSNDEIRIGPITRARAKLIEQQVNLLLKESDYFINENCLLPKSLYVCMIWFIGEDVLARGSKEVMQQGEQVLEQAQAKDAREEREAGIQGEEGGAHHGSKACYSSKIGAISCHSSRTGLHA